MFLSDGEDYAVDTDTADVSSGDDNDGYVKEIVIGTVTTLVSAFILAVTKKYCSNQSNQSNQSMR